MKRYQSIKDKEIADLLLAGKVGIIPTDTIYGIVAQASNEAAATRVLEVKGRKYKPGTLIAANLQQIIDLGIPRRFLTAVDQFWPGPVSVVVPVLGNKLTYLYGGVMSLPVRIPNPADLLNLLIKTGPLITTGANRPNKKPANTIKEAIDIFGSEIDFYVDGGNLENRPPSTIIRVIDDEIEVLREGAVEVTEWGIMKNKIDD